MFILIIHKSTFCADVVLKKDQVSIPRAVLNKQINESEIHD